MSPPPPAGVPSLAYGVYRVPSFTNDCRRAASQAGKTNHAGRTGDDQSVVTFATMPTVGSMDRGSNNSNKIASRFRSDEELMSSISLVYPSIIVIK